MSYRTENQTFPASLGLMVLRVVLGFTFMMHGWQKLNVFGLEGVGANFSQVGVPAAEIMAPVVAYLELIGGVALVLGLLSRLAGLLLFVNMLGAIVYVHAGNGFFASEGGVEFVLVLAAASFTIALTGPGRLSLGGSLYSRGRSSMLA